MSEEREERLMERLRDAGGQFVSGTEIAELLGVSRAAVGKRVTALRARGYEIEAVHNRGYRLVNEPDSLEPAAVGALLTTAWLGRVYLRHRTLSSTNDEAARLAADGAPHGTVVLADEQTSGRGRLGRPWRSPAGEGLYFSAVLRPRLTPAAAPPLTLAAAVGVAEGVRGFVGRPPTLKWPNDVLYDGRKLCGVLSELSVEGARVRHVILGVGINVNTETLPQELDRATSIRQARGDVVRRSLVLASVLGALERWIDRLVADGPRPVLDAWLTYADWIGQPLTVTTPQGELRGVALGLDEGGALRLRREDGSEIAVTAGEVSLYIDSHAECCSGQNVFGHNTMRCGYEGATCP
jgi:BirA family transcriptional regulator, biotin operon repressor / biotin---[acetyl-CoA-carboxylase] ligase